ncbi:MULTISPECIES: ubiquinol oxidase subunit II [Cupriavidus]|uniref:Ubiquinol oxidase subunit 2 n=2 Tax=Cupriavidus pinatubonensis TaxID=248026 RepID=Q46SF5_CUPPJ|nr:MULTISPECIES: ubiquinol oxidase subunit II [Cupriavidus]CAG9177513.1 Cytochrome bo(3) ubiquinol oxidase subunit 2 [Cupriavidus pinatubonensis]
MRKSIAALALLLGGCSFELLSPKGPVGAQERDLILLATGLMLTVVIPVIVLTLYFAWRYRETNTKAEYAPRWSHSTAIEVVVWGIPCVIVAALGIIIWETTHRLDPYRPLEAKVTPVEVDVVAMDWKWLFIYPQYGVASLNELAVPVGTPVNFRITAESTMNALFIPQLGSMVYAMSGMQTKLHLLADTPGVYDGRSAAYSGAGFSDMHFKTYATSREAFDAWIARARASGQALDERAYGALKRPSSKDPVTLYASVSPRLFQAVVDQYMPGMDGVCRSDSPATLQAALSLPAPATPISATPATIR